EKEKGRQPKTASSQRSYEKRGPSRTRLSGSGRFAARAPFGKDGDVHLALSICVRRRSLVRPDRQLVAAHLRPTAFALFPFEPRWSPRHLFYRKSDELIGGLVNPDFYERFVRFHGGQPLLCGFCHYLQPLCAWLQGGGGGGGGGVVPRPNPARM